MIGNPLRIAKKAVKQSLGTLGYEVRRRDPDASARRYADYRDIDEATLNLFATIEPYTLTGIERVAALREAVKYIVRHEVPGAIVECGVWKGGSMMASAFTLKECNSTDRSLYLFDTFSGMSEPTELDKDFRNADARQLMDAAETKKETANIWAMSNLEEVRRSMALTGYPSERVFFVEGKVEDTLPGHAPDQIALLRLDTDWFESTYHEMVHLFPRLVPGGVLIIDDYGHWQGARAAIDKYLSENNIRLLLNRIDYTGRIAVKCAP